MSATTTPTSTASATSAVSTTPTDVPAGTGHRIPRAVTISAWAVPIMVLGQFALISGVPVVIALVGAFARVRDRAVRAAAALLAVSFAIPLTIWLVRPDGAQSLSKDIHPGFVVLIVAAGAALVLALRRARSARPATR
ncbi:hypothetical protein [Streptomyces sp. RK9]|uniref:hypothetical protein n=1 Tax=Streptomyces sp. RK9 TaxID=3239284 RepID=UPI003866F3B5